MFRWLVWLSRIHCCRGFGIQSPTDYAFVRYVVNEHWPYYAYDVLREDDWLREKLGRLYMRLANWRQPTVILSDDYLQWFHAGCHQTTCSGSMLAVTSQTSYLLHQTSDIRHRASNLLASPSTSGPTSNRCYPTATSNRYWSLRTSVTTGNYGKR